MPSPDLAQTTEGVSPLRLGLRPNLAQFSLLATITFGVGLVVGAERVVVPVLARKDFAVATYLATLAFIVSFGFVKAALNLVAGRLADQYGRKVLLLIGWLVALPIPLLLIFAPSWSWIVAANLLLGVNQGLAWTMTVTSKIDLVGPRSRGFALGINEFSGYAGVSVGGFVGGWLGGIYGLRVAPFLFVLIVIVVMTCASLLVRETLPYAHQEQQERATATSSQKQNASEKPPRPSLGRIVALTTWGDRALAAASQAGLIEKFTDTLAWGLFPLYFASRGLAPVTIGAVVAAYTGTWAMVQIYTGHLSDQLGRKWLIVGGMWLAAVGIVLVALSQGVFGWLSGAVLMGIGMALLYPTLLAVVSDVAAPHWRATSLGVYRLWRDSGYAFGALAIGLVADAFGLLAGFWFAAGIMCLSGLLVAIFMYETLPTKRTVHPTWEREARWLQ